MSQDETPLVPAEPQRPREGWLERFKIMLGLKAPPSIREDLADALEETEANEADEDFTSEERRILRNLLTARDIRVADVMVPRGSIMAVAEGASVADLKALFASAGHSRLPVYGETLDDPKGMIHIRDLFARLDQLKPEASIASLDLMRPVLFAPGSMPALDLLLEMQAKHIHMALVIDEYGATDGLASIEDLLEIIVGEIEDEHDIADDSAVETFPDGAIAIGAQAELDEVASLTGVAFEPPSEDHDIGTIGGYITAFLGRVPAPGEIVTAPNGLVVTILEGDARRLRRVRISPALPTPDEA
jgi:CBS domain containing-hemolysin-like protein